MNRHDQEYLVQKIRTQYTEKEHTQLDSLRELDARVKRPANAFAYVLGAAGAIVMGSGMSLVMTDIGESVGIGSSMAPGVVIGVVGMLIAIVNYPIYKKILSSRKNKYAAEIMRLSERILDETHI